jgi:hypothetical protein
LAIKKTTTEKAREHEEFVATMYDFENGRRSKSSGAAWHDPVDVTTDKRVIECEYTENQSYSLKLSFWQEVVSKISNGRTPALAIRFRDKHSNRHVDLLVTSLHDDVEERSD